MYSLLTSKVRHPASQSGLNWRWPIVLTMMGFCSPAGASDWAYELHSSAKQVYSTKAIQIPCSEIPSLLSAKAEKSIYLAVRDAALFRNQACRQIIKKYHGELEKIPGVPDAMSFYDYRNGDANGLRQLARSFDADARRTQDHWTVEIFGFIGDWSTAGRRLARHSSYSDGAGTEVLCSALKWRRYLYGEVDFEENWFSIGKQEGVKQDVLQDMFDNCRP